MLLSPECWNLDLDKPLQEYPTPQFRRDSFFCLNGKWDFEITKSNDHPFSYTKKILVPFSVEAPLSGVGKRITSDDVLHYRLFFSLPQGFARGRVLLHFEAVDQKCDVFLNGVKIAHHEGGYLSFTIDMMELRDGDNCLQVDVKDDTSSPIFPRGKQMDKNGGIWYTPTSGIWGTVWVESVPKEVIKGIRLTPKFDEKIIQINCDFEGKVIQAEAEVSTRGKSLAKVLLDDRGNGIVDLKNFFEPWNPSHPFLYDLRIKINDDEVFSYFAMRKFSSIDFGGWKVFALNNEPLFLSGVLDQGYFPAGGLTAPSDKAMLDDLQMIKDMGFNMVRKHIKIEPMRWYYHCDQLGLLVNQDFVSGGAPYKMKYIVLRPFLNFGMDDTLTQSKKNLGREDVRSRARFIEDLHGTVKRLYNCPSIFSWTIFNEGWGQFDTFQCLSLLRIQDNTRLVDADSGWYDQGLGDFDSHHIYFRKLRMKNDGKRILSLSEFGGYSCRIKDHVFSSRNFGYKSFGRKDELTRGIVSLYADQVLPLIKNEGLSVAVLTQLSDVEEETNGLVTYDRHIIKVDVETMRIINGKLSF